MKYISSNTTDPFGMGIDVWTESGTNTNIHVIGNTIHDVDSIGLRVRDDWNTASNVNTGILIKNNRIYKTGNTALLITGYANGVLSYQVMQS